MQSQRYVKLGGAEAVVPPSIAERPDLAAEFSRMLEELWNLYRRLVDGGVPPEDARYILPNACETKLVVTMNARELLHFFSLRLCNRAQWEIRLLALEMLRAVSAVAPGLFAEAGPGCVAGPCPEGEFSCGRAAEVRANLKALFS